MRRTLPALGLLLAAPVCAEYLAAYLPSTGDLPELAAGAVFLAPLYGGAALLIREVVIRRQLGLAGLLLFGAAFGVAMPTLVDLSLWTPEKNVTGWDDVLATTAGGVPIFAAVQFAAGHALISIGAPVALFEALSPATRGRPLLGRTSALLVAATMLLIAAAIHADARPQAELTPLALPASALLVAGLMGCGLVASRRPGLGSRAVRAPAAPVAPAATVAPVAPVAPLAPLAPVRAFGAGLILMLAIDLTPPTWLGLIALVATIGIAIRVATAWPLGLGAKDAAAAGAGVLIARTLVGLAAPLPPGVSELSKVAQSAILLAAVGAIGWLATQRAAAS